jgi:N-acetylmuramoyl-L-alanine amidase
MNLLIITLLLSPPLTTHLQSTDTGALSISETRINDNILEVTVSGDIDFLRGRDLEREDLINRLLWSAREIDPSIAGIQVYTPGGRLLSDALHDPREEALIRLLRFLPRPPLRGLPPQELPYGGSLTGKTIALSPGHGWVWSGSNWGFQRPLINMPDCTTCLGIIEDLSNAEIAARYLIPHLLRAGATVWSVRERDFSSSELIVDEDSDGVIEEGAWEDGTSAGGLWDDYRVMLVSGGGSVTYPLEPESEGVYWVSVWYVEGGNRVSDALFEITHLGGTAAHRLDQTRNGSRWIHLGAYRFAPGQGGQLRISPGPDAAGDDYLIADAVRLGGGFETIESSGIPANKPRWMMSALWYLKYFGLPEAVSTGGDVTVRPAFAEWQGADAYLSLHSNAGSATGTASGTSTYRYNCGTYPDHSAAPDPSLCDDPPGSDALQRSVHLNMVNTLRDRWDPEWRDRGVLVANFGEMRVLDQIPGALVESAFHDGINLASAEMRMPDNQALQDPRFRYWLGYAMYAGLAEFFDPQAVLLPAMPPVGVHLIHDAESGLLAAWDAVEGADGYRVRYNIDGLGLGEGIVTADLSAVIDDAQPGQVVAVRVSALNAGGEGPPSELVAARYRGNGAYADVLLVSGFDRQDAYIGDFRNRRDQAWAHAEAIAAIAGRNIYFDCASNESVIAGAVPLEPYRAVIWILGEESSVDETFDDQEQALVTAYLEDGGLMATGAEIGWDLMELGLPADISFFANTFDAAYLADDAETSRVSGVGIFAGLSEFTFDDGNLEGAYPAEYPDVFDGQVVLEYEGGQGAGVIYERPSARTLLVGFPFETIVSADARRDLMDLALLFLMPGHTPDDYDSDGLPDEWEYENDTGPRTPSADDDPDKDGRTNLEEYRDGTDPQVSDKKKNGCGCGGGGASLILLPLFLLLRRRR